MKDPPPKPSPKEEAVLQEPTEEVIVGELLEQPPSIEIIQDSTSPILLDTDNLEVPELSALDQAQKQSVPQHILIKDKGKARVVDEEVQTKRAEWIISIENKLNKASNDNEEGAILWPKHCIYRIPRCLRDACKDDRAYIPQVVSLGPYHHGAEQLLDMEPHKWRALQRIMDRSRKPLEYYITEMEKHEEKARQYYDEPIMLNTNQFVEMMVLDSSFLFEILSGYTGDFVSLGYSRHDPIFGLWTPILKMIVGDIIKLENQIPLFLLDSLFDVGEESFGSLLVKLFDPSTTTEIAFGSYLLKTSGEFPLENATLTTSGELPMENAMLTTSGELPLGTSRPTTSGEWKKEDCPHLLQVFRKNLLAGQTSQVSLNLHKNDQRQLEDLPCVTGLIEAGMKFKKRESAIFWDIKYKNGVLEIPQLLFHDGTESLLLNLIAYEQCHMNSTNDIASYVLFMDSLIDTPADVSYLCSRGIIVNWMGSDAVVAELFNRMGQGVGFDVNNYLSGLSRLVSDYHHNACNRHLASLRHTYFNNPWAIISLVAAAVLLLFTGVQTYFTVRW